MENIFPIHKNMPNDTAPEDTSENHRRLGDELWQLRERLIAMQAGLEIAQHKEKDHKKWTALRNIREDIHALVAVIPTKENPEPLSEQKFWEVRNSAKKILGEGEEVYSDNVIPFEKIKRNEAA